MVGKQLGEGGYATVWRVLEREPDGKTRQLAVKRIVYHAADDDARMAVCYFCPRPHFHLGPHSYLWSLAPFLSLAPFPYFRLWPLFHLGPHFRVGPRFRFRPHFHFGPRRARAPPHGAYAYRGQGHPAHAGGERVAGL